ncbi:MAG: CotH kinase family protein [Candidatus Cloacimonetes bacterium]|nr:CotH kinase family protein [Candidatus Cloacimonadota bacterium]
MAWIIACLIFSISASYGSTGRVPILSHKAVFGICINEIMASNETTIADNDGDFEDWVELWNLSEEPVSLEGWGLSDKASEPFRWVFPNEVLQPDQFMLVWCSKKDRSIAGAPLHTNFGISASGEALYLTCPTGEQADYVPATALQTDISLGRYPDGTGPWFFFDEPTPGESNSTQHYEELLAPPVFSLPGGFYTEGLQLEMSHPDPEVVIVYTLDGSEPDLGNLNGTTYQYKNSYPNSPGQAFGAFLESSFLSYLHETSLEIQNRSSESNKISLISSTHDFNPSYFPRSKIRKGTVVRAKAFKPGAIASDTITHTYFVFAEGRDKYILPVISFSVQEDLLFDYDKGIYTAGIDFDTWRQNNPNDAPTGGYANIGNWVRSGEQWEYPANFELFETDENSAVLNQRIGFRIHGGISRMYSRKTLRIYARDIYGRSSLNHSFFKDQTYNSYKRILLRNSGNDYKYTLLKDLSVQEICGKLNFDIQASQPAVVFINGEYWGLHNIRERYDKHYLARVYGVDAENLDLLELASGINEGDRTHFIGMMLYVYGHDLSNPSYYEHVQTLLDKENFIDYHIAEIFCNNTDWPPNNTKYWRQRTSSYIPNAPYGHDGRWRWLMYDMDKSFQDIASTSTNTLARVLNGASHSPILLNALLQNDGFRAAFINRFADLMNSHFQPTRMVDIIQKNKALIAPEVPEHIARWRNITVDSFNLWIDRMIDFANNRPDYQRQHIRSRFGITSNVTITLDVNNDLQGRVRINSIDICEDTPGIPEAPYPWDGIYFHSVPIEVEAKALPGYTFSHWEGDATGTEPILSLAPQGDIYLKAVFTENAVSEADIIHYWHFNSLPNGTLTQVESDYSADGTALITYPGTGTGYLDTRTHRAADPVSNLNLLMDQEPDQGAVLRVRNPSNTRELIVSAPSTGFQDITGAYATTRTSNGAQEQELYYSTNGGTSWTQIGTSYTIPELPSWSLRSFDISGDPDANNNQNLMFRILFTGEGADNDAGNDRFDNFSLHGITLPFANLPPVTDLAIHQAPEDSGILLEWTYPTPVDRFLIYSSDHPYFHPTPENLLITVNYPGNQYLDSTPHDRRFYIVIAERDDSPGRRAAAIRRP